MVKSARMGAVCPTIAIDSTILATDGGESSSFLANFGVTAAVAFIPFIAIAGTSFIKIALVLAILRSALGSPGIIPAPILTALAAILSLFVMVPVGAAMVSALESVSTSTQVASDPFGLKQARLLYDAVSPPLIEFLKVNTPASEINYFSELAGASASQEPGLRILLPAFAVGEVAEAFVIGFLIFVPFLVIDLIVTNTLLSLGMQTLSPMAISLPLKLLLFTVVDGWHILLDGLMVSYGF